jgi:hypothetical protein
MDRADPSTPPDRLRRIAEAMLRAGQFDQAERCLAEAGEQGHDPQAGLELLECLCRLGRFAEALPLADRLSQDQTGPSTVLARIHSAWFEGRFQHLDPDCPLDRIQACAEALFSSRSFQTEQPLHRPRSRPGRGALRAVGLRPRPDRPA